MTERDDNQQRFDARVAELAASGMSAAAAERIARFDVYGPDLVDPPAGDAVSERASA